MKICYIKPNSTVSQNKRNPILYSAVATAAVLPSENSIIPKTIWLAPTNDFTTKESWVPPIIKTLNPKNFSSENLKSTFKEGMVEALREVFVDPFCNFLSTTWDLIVNISPVVCMVICVFAGMFSIAGFETGKKTILITIISFLLILLLDVVIKAY